MWLQVNNSILPKELSFIPIVVPIFGLLVPLIIRFLEQRNRLKKAKEFVELVKTRDDLLQLSYRFSSTEQDNLLLQKTETHLRELERSLYASPKRKRVKTFVWFIVAEVIFFITGIYFGILKFLQKIMVGKSHETNIPFFEGVFAHPVSRVILILCYLFISLIYMERLNKKIQQRYPSPLAYNIAMVVLFNVLFVACVLVGSTLLYWIDFINPYF